MYAHTTCFTYRQTPETERLDEETHAAANIWKSEPTDYRGDPQQLHLIANISTLIPLLDHRAGAPWHGPKRKPSLNGPLKNRVWDYRDDCGCQIKHLILFFRTGRAQRWLTHWCEMSQYWRGTFVQIRISHHRDYDHENGVWVFCFNTADHIKMIVSFW